MSDGKRLLLGIALMLAAVVTVAAGILPIPQTGETMYSGKGEGTMEILPIPVLREDAPVNTGNARELSAIPGIGETIGENMVSERTENGLFLYPEDLISVRGIGQKKLEQILPLLILAGEEGER
ncbi:MAG: helix-hairpin-helix domain-containing protein [Clostridia bacterium]|nr:helix-hairpin-helix domain-containing protein [Clostridia bacterium]